MNNYEKIKSMTIDKMADFLQDIKPCDICVCDCDSYKCMAIGCKEGIKQWLESEVKE